MGILIVSCNPNKKNRIIYTNSRIVDILNHTEHSLSGKHVNILIPEIIQSQHNQFIDDFLLKANENASHY